MRTPRADDDIDLWAEPPAVTVDVTTDPQVVGMILGPDGEPLHIVLAPKLPFGFGRR